MILLFTCKGNFHKRLQSSVSSIAFNTTEVGSHGIIGGSIQAAAVGSGAEKPGQVIPIAITPNTYTYNFAPGPCGGSITQDHNDSFLLPFCAGFTPTPYTFTAQNAEGCKAVETITITPTIVTGTSSGGTPDNYISSVKASTCGASNGQATVICSSCTGNVYSWDGGSPIGNVNTALSPGAHSVVVNNSFTLYVHIPLSGTLPAVFAGFDRTVGKGCETFLQATPNLSGYNYEWFAGSSNVPFAQARTKWVTAWSAGNYRVKVTHPTSGCTNEDIVHVNPTVFMSAACIPWGWQVSTPCDRDFNYTAKVSDETPTETLTSTLTISKNTYFDKILTVGPGGNLTISDCEFRMSTNSQILIKGGTVTVNNALVVPCDEGFHPYFWGSGGSSQWVSIGSRFEENATSPIRLDSTSNSIIQNCMFARSTVGIELNDCQLVTITNNTFYDNGTAVKSTGNHTIDVTGQLESNLIMSGTNGFDFTGDHSLLSIGCNTLEYTEYGILSEGTLSNFGHQGLSSGNIFISNSTNTNHQICHEGNQITFYYGPENSLSLNSNFCDVTASPAMLDMNCPDYNNYRTSPPEVAAIEERSFNLYSFPNPTYAEVQIGWELPEPTDDALFYLYEAASGKKLLDMQIKASTSQMTVDLSPYSGGVYIGVLRLSSGESKVIKIVKTL